MFLAHRPGAPHTGVGRGRFEGEALGVEGGAALEKEEDGVGPVGLRGPQRHAEHRPGLRRGGGPVRPPSPLRGGNHGDGTSKPWPHLSNDSCPSEPGGGRWIVVVQKILDQRKTFRKREWVAIGGTETQRWDPSK